MFNFKGIVLGVALVLSCMPAYAEEQAEATRPSAVKPAAVTAKEIKAPKPYDIVTEMTKQLPSLCVVGEVTKADMEASLRGAAPDNKLYLVSKNDKILAFRDIAEDQAACRQIVYASPKATMLELYTNDKKTANQMYRALRHYNSEWRLVDGSRVVSEKSPAIKLDNGKSLYRIWYKKVKPDNRAVRVWSDYPAYPYPPIGIGVVWGRYHHHGGYYRPAPRPHGPGGRGPGGHGPRR